MSNVPLDPKPDDAYRGQQPEAPTDRNDSETRHASGTSPTKRLIKIGSQRESAEASGFIPQPAPPAVIVTDTELDEPAESVAAIQNASRPMDDPRSVATDAPIKFPPPRRMRDTSDVQREIDDELAGISFEELLTGRAGPRKGAEPQIDERYEGSIVKLHGDHVFFSLPGGYEGVAPRKQFATDPIPGSLMEVVVRRFNGEDGLYELSVPGQSVSVADWSDIDEGALVEARVTAHNSGGLECDVNGIRAFMPVSQISQYRVEDLEQFVNERFKCVVTEANPERRNLVLSRRAVLEREEAETKQKMLASLKAGELREGIVRSIRDFGAFVDIGGVDGLVHISKLSWDRVKHPSDVLEEGQRIQVKVESIDEVTGKISLSYRDTIVHPWETALQRYTEHAIVTGIVSKIMDFGAFVRLEAGIEGLVHISELAHHRVSRVDSVVKVGDRVDVKILSIDPDNQRISLSLKAVKGLPASSDVSDSSEADEETSSADEAVAKMDPSKPSRSLKGGITRRSGGEQFGLKW